VICFAKTQRGLPVTSWLGSGGGLQSADVVAADNHACAATPPPSLVLGFGNVLLSDDGAGVHLVERLRLELGPDAAESLTPAP
jgi:hypothetical protein